MGCACRCHSRRLVRHVPWSEVRVAGMTLITLAGALLDLLR
jgi:hypothetical protein